MAIDEPMSKRNRPIGEVSNLYPPNCPFCKTQLQSKIHCVLHLGSAGHLKKCRQEIGDNGEDVDGPTSIDGAKVLLENPTFGQLHTNVGFDVAQMLFFINTDAEKHVRPF